MKVRRLIPIGVAAVALLFAQGVFAQSDQTAGSTTTQTVKKAKRKAKKETTGKSTEATDSTVNSKSQSMETPTTTRRARTETTGSAQRAATTISESEITAAKADGKVWVNTSTGVYHKSGQYYGNTKQGKFMTEQEAIRAGFRAAKR